MFLNLNPITRKVIALSQEKLKLPLGVNKYQYLTTNDHSNLEKIKNKNRRLNGNPEFYKYNHCLYCGNKESQLISGFYHDKSGFNLWMYNSAECVTSLCAQCNQYFNSNNIRYNNVTREVGSVDDLLKLEPEVLLPTIESVEDNYFFLLDGTLIGKNERSNNTIFKFGLNRRELILRRKNVIIEFSLLLISHLTKININIKRPKIKIPFDLSKISWMDLNFISDNIELIYIFCLNKTSGDYGNLRSISNPLITNHTEKSITEISNIITSSWPTIHKSSIYPEDITYNDKLIDSMIEFAKKYKHTKIENNEIIDIKNSYSNSLKEINTYKQFKLSNNNRSSFERFDFYKQKEEIKRRNKNSLSFTYGKHRRIRSLSFSGIRCFNDNAKIELNNSTIVLIGENGVGKSTLMSLIKNITSQQKINLIDLAEENTASIICNINYVDNINDFNFKQTKLDVNTNGPRPKMNFIHIDESRLSKDIIIEHISLIINNQDNKQFINFIFSSLQQLFNLEYDVSIKNRRQHDKYRIQQ